MSSCITYISPKPRVVQKLSQRHVGSKLRCWCTFVPWIPKQRRESRRGLCLYESKPHRCMKLLIQCRCLVGPGCKRRCLAYDRAIDPLCHQCCNDSGELTIAEDEERATLSVSSSRTTTDKAQRIKNTHRETCQCKCGCTQSPNALIRCSKCHRKVGPGCIEGCLAYDRAIDPLCHECCDRRPDITMAVDNMPTNHISDSDNWHRRTQRRQHQRLVPKPKAHASQQ